MSKIDLHIHSSFSADGEFTPQELMQMCKEQGMMLVAITDHNSVRGVAGALAAADGMRVLSGVELDCTCGGRGFHLLGYGFDYTRKEFLEIEQNILKQEQAAAEKKIDLFQKETGIQINTAEVFAAAENGVVTGELIAEHLLSQKNAAQHQLLLPYLQGGAKSDMPNVRFYWDFFSEGKAAYVPIRYLALSDAVRLIHSAGGIAVLAHPGQNLTMGDALLTTIISESIDGIEVFSSYHNKAATEHYAEVAKQCHLLATCGSDFHGKHKPNIVLGGHGATYTDEALLANISGYIKA